MSRFWEKILNVFEYLLGFFIVLSGLATSFAAPVEHTGLGFIYSNKYSLLMLGCFVILSGLILLYGKFRKSIKWVSIGLFSIFLSFLFAAILNAIAFGFAWPTWTGNLTAAVAVGALWIYHKLKYH